MDEREWKEVKLDEVCLNITDGSHTSPSSVEKGYYMASVKDMDEYSFSTCSAVSQVSTISRCSFKNHFAAAL